MRRDVLAAPRGASLEYVATVRVGNATATTTPVRSIEDSKVGIAVTFRQQIELVVDDECDVGDCGVVVTIQSVCGTVNLGEAHCRSSKVWSPLLPSCGEALCAFAAGQQPTTGKPPPNAIRPTSAARSSATVGTLAVRISDVEGVIVSANNLELFAVAQYAMQVKHTSTVESTVRPAGHSAIWHDELLFEASPSSLNRTVLVNLFGNWGGRQSQLLGGASFDIATTFLR